MLTIEEKREGHIIQVSLNGKLDLNTTDSFTTKLAGLPKNEIILLNASDLEYISSIGLRSLVLLKKECDMAEGDFVIAGAKGMVASVLTIAGLDKIISMYDTVPDAMQGIQAG